MKNSNLISGLIAGIQTLARGHERFLLGLAGAPASGKSTLAETLAAGLPSAQVLAMDGFHLDDAILNAHGTYARKGAPNTFDVAGFVSTLTRLKTRETLYAPVFDRDLEIARAGAAEIRPDTQVILVEGNYLLHDSDGWQDVRPRLDACWALDVAIGDLEKRLVARWADHGYGDAEARAKIEGNDLPNARLVAGTLARADRIIAGL